MDINLVEIHSTQFLVSRFKAYLCHRQTGVFHGDGSRGRLHGIYRLGCGGLIAPSTWSHLGHIQSSLTILECRDVIAVGGIGSDGDLCSRLVSVSCVAVSVWFCLFCCACILRLFPFGEERCGGDEVFGLYVWKNRVGNLQILEIAIRTHRAGITHFYRQRSGVAFICECQHTVFHVFFARSLCGCASICE